MSPKAPRPRRERPSKTANGLTSIDGPGHPIIVGAGALEQAPRFAREWAPAHRYAIVSDARVATLYGATVESAFRESKLLADSFTFPEGEQFKTRDTWATLTDELLSTGFGRDSAVVALGGGVTGDIGGFVAATYMRGIPVIQIPTTLAAMVDASIGGKTGVDTAQGKNLVGAFHPPAGVLADPQVLKTLPLRQLQSGLAEVLKHGAIADAAYFHQVAEGLPDLLAADAYGGNLIHAFIVRSMAIKSEIVRSDVRESGRRKILNFGHTIGHAIEAASRYLLLHGEAVSIGMVVESAAAERAGIAEAGTSAVIRKALASAGLPVAPPSPLTAEQILSFAAADKKTKKGVVEFAVPKRIGEMARAGGDWTVPLPLELVEEAML